jgi:hypothetical protein
MLVAAAREDSNGAPSTLFHAASFQKRNDAQRGPSPYAGFLSASLDCARISHVGHREFADSPREFDEGGGLKDRRLGARKMSSGQVLISRTLTVCGEVAERPKAAVC